MPKYLFKRPDSQNWCVRFRYPHKVVEKSLGTPDLKEAEILAGPYITQHKAALLALKPRLEVTWRRDYEPGLHDAPNCERVAATETELTFYDASGKLLRKAPNGGPEFQIVNLEHRLGIPSSGRMIQFDEKEARKAATADDDAVIETYLKNAKHGPVTGYDEREARAVWSLFKMLTDNKRLKDCDRDDGRKLVAHFEEQGLKSATIEKKVAWLNAAVNIAIRDGKLKLNPFAGVAPKRDDKLKRKKLDAADIKTIKHNLARLDKNDQLLVRLLASTGMRIGEAFEIGHEEERERGVRFVIVGHKTEESLRRVPLPDAVLPYLPKKITGPLFKRDAADPADAASKRLNRFLDDIGITDPRKVVHSFRHRAQDRLRAAECPQDIRWALLGHEEKTVAEDYGEGFSVPQLKRWIDKIGF
ncbi:MAG TPA: tyrosine-type recombinase/integrase [Xanthobacteraceae bacterium]|nr:tyrosine-type recombinase/integrase [Xanthobacteraceae bacterium]